MFATDVTVFYGRQKLPRIKTCGQLSSETFKLTYPHAEGTRTKKQSEANI